MCLLKYFQARLAADLHTLSAMTARSYKSFHAPQAVLIRPAMQAEASTHCRLPLPITDVEAVLAIWTAFSQGHSLCPFLTELERH